MNNYQISSQQARIPAPAKDKIDANHDVDAKKLIAHAPSVYLKCDKSALRLGNPGNEDLNPMTSGKQDDAKKFFHAPQTKKALPIDDCKSATNGSDETMLQEKERIAGHSSTKKALPIDSYNSTGGGDDGNPGNHHLNTMTPEEKAYAKKLDQHTPPVYLESNQAKSGALRLGDPDNGDDHPMASRKEEHIQNLFHIMPPEPPEESDRKSPGAFRADGQDNDDGTDGFKVVSARLVNEDPEVDIVVAVVAKDESGNKKRLIYISIGVLVIFVVVAIVLGVTLSPRSSPAPTPLQRDFMISLIQSRSVSTTFSNTSSPQSHALDWILTDPYSSDGLSEDRLLQRFALATFYHSTNGDEWSNREVGQWLNSTNECLWDGNVCSPEFIVDGIDLIFDGLSGRIPIELSFLTQLKALELKINHLSGSLPSEFGLLTQLTAFLLCENAFTGSLPSEFGLLTQLTKLSLYDNLLTGSLPSEFGLLMQLTALFLYNNTLTGSLPFELGLLNQLKILSLYNNILTGSLPSELVFLTGLTELSLGDNQLTGGSLPSELGLLTQLKILSLYNITLTGSLPSELGLLNQLLALALESNRLIGTLPSELGLLPELKTLSLYRNQLTGSLPSELGLLNQLDLLSLFNNTLTGSMPSSLCSADVEIAIDCGEIACTCCLSGVGVYENGVYEDSCPS
jgi:Leucine-rich repeat (LRR) protein